MFAWRLLQWTVRIVGQVMISRWWAKVPESHHCVRKPNCSASADDQRGHGANASRD